MAFSLSIDQIVYKALVTDLISANLRARNQKTFIFYFNFTLVLTERLHLTAVFAIG